LALVGLVLLLRLLLLLGFSPCKQLLGSIAWRAAASDAAAAGLSMPECSACRYCCKAADEYPHSLLSSCWPTAQQQHTQGKMQHCEERVSHQGTTKCSKLQQLHTHQPLKTTPQQFGHTVVR
jgi:hypothetical protein